MNKNIRIKVKTPLGETDAVDTGPGVAQGSVDGSILSSSNLASGAEDTFTDPDKELKYEDLVIFPPIFMDDIEKLSNSVEAAQYGNDKMEELVGRKKLQLNIDKSGFLIMGNKKARKTIESQLVKNPLTLKGERMKREKVLKFLGDYFSEDLEDSIHQTVIRRIGIAKHTMYEIRSVIEDTRAEHLGGINLAFSLWDAAVVPMVLFNAESWWHMSKKTLKLLNGLFNDFHRCIMRISTGCPIANMYWQCGSYLPQNLILQRQLNFLHHVANLPVGSLARDVHDLEEAFSHDGLLQVCKEHLNNLGVVSLRDFSKWQFKSKVKKYLQKKNADDLVEMATKYKKINYQELACEPFGRKEYFSKLSLENVRYRFRISNKLVSGIRKNFSAKYRKKNISLYCPTCKDTDNNSVVSTNRVEHSQSHVLYDCEAFSDLREDLDTEDDGMLVEYFKKVVERLIQDEAD